MKTILIHGSGQKAASWTETVSYMKNNDDILCPELSSLLNGKEASYNNLYSSFTEYCNKIDGQIHLSGISLGGILALNYAVTDMERIIHNLMEYCNINEQQFREKLTVENDIETLYFPYYEYVKNHPITKWKHKTYILRGETDTLCEHSYVKDFADKFGCELTIQKDGEHWFHTKPQLEFFRLWISNRL